MKKFFSALALVALLNFSVAGYSLGGEVKKQPLQLQELTELVEEQAADYEEVRDTEAGIAAGYGILTLALAVGIGYLIYDQLYDDDD